MLRKIRIFLAAIIFIVATLLFLDFTGTLRQWLGWIAKIQFLPAILAFNFVTVAVFAVITILFGRIYCSVICPLGIFQDGISWFSSKRKGKKARFHYSKEVKWLRYGMLVLFVVALVAGLHVIVAILAPYSSYGRIAQNFFAPLVQWGNNLLAYFSERVDSYSFATKEVWIKSLPTFIIAGITLIAVVILSWRNGRTYCNTICPVGTVLSFLSRFSMFKPTIDESKCISCGLCEKKCKASCIDIKGKKFDYSRCVDCFDCIDSCKAGALQYRFAWKKSTDTAVAKSETVKSETADQGRRAFLVGSALAIGGSVASISANAQTDEDSGKKTDGGFTDILPKEAPKRELPITPFGSISIKEFYDHCTACQLCVAECPNDVLRPSKSLNHLMQPEMSFEKGYCRPECVRCSELCPTGAILKITPEEKTTWKVGTAIVDHDLCVVNKDGVSCGNCARHCPVGAISMVRINPDDKHSLRIPTVDEERCIGCGACENLCPSRPISAITIKGYAVHHKED